MAKEKQLIEAKFNGSVAEKTGEHDVFVDGNRITFVDGVVTVTQGQYDLLKRNGYVAEEPEDVPSVEAPYVSPFTKLADINESPPIQTEEPLTVEDPLVIPPDGEINQEEGGGE